MRGRRWACHLYGVVRDSVIEKGTSEQRFEGNDKIRQTDMWAKRIPAVGTATALALRQTVLGTSKEQQGDWYGSSGRTKKPGIEDRVTWGEILQHLLSYCEIYFSHNEWIAIMRISLSLSSYISTVTSQLLQGSALLIFLMITDICYCLQKFMILFHIITTHMLLPSPTATHTQSRKIAYQWIEGLARTLTGKWH